MVIPALRVMNDEFSGLVRDKPAVQRLYVLQNCGIFVTDVPEVNNPINRRVIGVFYGFAIDFESRASVGIPQYVLRPPLIKLLLVSLKFPCIEKFARRFTVVDERERRLRGCCFKPMFYPLSFTKSLLGHSALPWPLRCQSSSRYPLKLRQVLRFLTDPRRIQSHDSCVTSHYARQQEIAKIYHRRHTHKAK